jgi:hypothetical protein
MRFSAEDDKLSPNITPGKKLQNIKIEHIPSPKSFITTPKKAERIYLHVNPLVSLKIDEQRTKFERMSIDRKKKITDMIADLQARNNAIAKVV